MKKIYRTVKKTALVLSAAMVVSAAAPNVYAAKSNKNTVIEHNKQDIEDEIKNSSVNLWKAGLSDYASSSSSSRSESRETKPAATEAPTSAVTKKTVTSKTTVAKVTEAPKTTAKARSATKTTVAKTTAKTTAKTSKTTKTTTVTTKAANSKDSKSDPVSSSYKNESTKKEPKQIKRDEDKVKKGYFLITSYGFGHGLGLSQNGANYWATYGGMGYRDILAHYYKDTYIKTNKDAKDETISAGGVSGSVLDVISMVVYNEMSDVMNPEAMKAQAVAAYSYILHNGGSADDLIPKSNPPKNVRNAVNQVLGEALYYKDKPILAVFDASGGGSTASSEDIFGNNIPYLKSVDEKYDKICDPYYGRTELLSSDEVRSILTDNFSGELSKDPSKWIKINEGDGGYVSSVTVGDDTMSGLEFSRLFDLKSSKFTFEYGK